VLLLVVSVHGYRMFRWQLVQRRTAAIHVAAGYTIAGRWIRHAPQPEDLVPQVGTPELPTALCLEIAQIRHNPGPLDQDLTRAERWTTAVLVVLAVAALVRFAEKVWMSGVWHGGP
jgi:hypothetical protein